MDHFYAGCEEAEFTELRRLSEILPGTIHSRVESGGDNWEGLYIYAMDGTYFELIKKAPEPKNYKLGIALSPRLSHYVDAATIAQEMPWIRWNHLVRYNGKSQDIWFESFKVQPDPSRAPPLSAWVMKYHPTHQPQLPNNRRAGIETFNRVAALMDEASYATVFESAQWIYGQHTFGTTRTILRIPTRRRGRIFEMDIELCPQTSGVQVTEVEATTVNDTQIEPGRIGPFVLSQTGPTLRFNRA